MISNQAHSATLSSLLIQGPGSRVPGIAFYPVPGIRRLEPVRLWIIIYLISKYCVVQAIDISIRETFCKPLFLSLALVFGIIIFLFNGLPKLMTPTVLERVKQDGELIVYTRNSPATYYEGPDAPAGLEYDMAKMFADELGVKLTMIIPETLNDIREGVQDGTAHLAAAGLTVTEEREKLFRFGPAYQEITEQLLYHADSPKPKNLSKLGGGTRGVRLFQIQQRHPGAMLDEQVGGGETDTGARSAAGDDHVLVGEQHHGLPR